MDSNQKKFNLYVFLSTFSRNLIEVFIPIILYKYGYSLSEIMFYYLIANTSSLILMFPCLYISKQFSNKILSIIGIISFTIMQIFLNFMWHSYIYLLILGIIFALYRRGYWIARRYYNLKVITKKNISSTYALISIINQVSVILSAYIGSLLLDFISIKVLTIISIILFLSSIIPLNKLDNTKKSDNKKMNLIKTIKRIPFSNLYLFGSYELLNVIKFLFPLYLFIYVKNNYQTVGILNLIANLSTMLFAYLYGKKINKDKNYLKLCILLITSVYILKVNITSYLLVIIVLIEGIVLKMHELSISKEFYVLSKKFNYTSYNATYEFIQNLFRTILVLILYLFIKDLKTMIYVTLFFIFIGIFFNFKQLSIKDYDEKDY